MSREDRERWDARYRAGEHVAESIDAFVAAALERVEASVAHGTALDLACGAGRHALELARRGWSTSAWDVSPVALEIVARRARERGLAIATREVDLEEGVAVSESFDLVLVADYFEPNLLPSLEGLVAPNGHLIYATFAPDWPGERPSPGFRVETRELVERIPGFAALVASSDGGRAGLLARRISASRPA